MKLALIALVGFGGLWTPPARAQCVPAPSNLVSWWRGEGDAADSTGGNHGTLLNGATFAPGKVGQALSFDGVNDYVLIGNPPSLAITQGVTVEAWVRPTIPLPDGRLAVVLVKWGIVLQGDSYGLWLRGGSGTLQAFGAIGDGRTSDDGFWGGTVPLGAFTHVAMTYDASSGLNRLFVNGLQVASRARPGGIFNSSHPVVIGRHADGAPVPRPFRGQVDEVSVFNRALDPPEILAIYNAGFAGKCSACYPDCDLSTGVGSLDIFDFLCFQNRYAALDPYACDCDTSTGRGACDIFDFLCFQNAYDAGCP